MSFRGVIAYCCLAVFWATFFVGLALGVGALGIGLAAGTFGVVGGLSLLVMAKIVGRDLRWHPDWSAILMWAAIGFVVFLMVTTSVSHLGAALSAVVVSSIPLFATVVGQMRGLERVTGLGALSILLGIGGLMLVAAFPLGDPSWGFLGGVLSALVAAIAAGSCGRHLVVRLHSPRAPETAIMAALIAGLGALALTPFTPPPGPVEVGPIITIIALAIGCAFLGLFALSAASDSVPRRTAATLPGVGTLLAALAGIAVLHESMSVPQVFGMLLILAASALLRGLVPRWFPASWRS
jgi:drug/metabolite transporter (DMT)-like permease